jgi:hypothetical protein
VFDQRPRSAWTEYPVRDQEGREIAEDDAGRHRAAAERQSEVAGPRWENRRSPIDEPVANETSVSEGKHPAERRHREHEEAANTDPLFPCGIARDVGQRRAPVDVHRANGTPID